MTIYRTLLRKETLAARDQLVLPLRREKSRRIVAQLCAHPAVITARHLFVYVHVRSEVETLPLIGYFLSVGKIVSVPFTLRQESHLLAVRITDPENQLAPGCFGILEPVKELAAQAVVNPADIDAALIPGSVFDRSGGRLGYGGGFYDRFLSQDAPQAVRIGLAYEMQLIEHVPIEPHDQLMDILVTEVQLHDCRSRRIFHAQDSSVP